MADEEHLAILRQGVDAWNAWREKEPSVRPNLVMADLIWANLLQARLNQANLSGADLSEADLCGADLSEAGLSEADLHGAKLIEANLYEADLSEADLSEADLSMANLREANLSEANLSGADLSGADLSMANLRGANLGEANVRVANLSGAKLDRASLMRANLIDACLDGADLTGAKLWETQRTGWSIKNVICRVAFWDRDGKEPTKYEEGEFERIFAEKPRIILRYAGGISLIDLLALPLVVERLQAEYPGSVLQIHSMQNDAGGASVTITVEDRAGRDPEAFEQELVRIQTKLNHVHFGNHSPAVRT